MEPTVETYPTGIGRWVRHLTLRPAQAPTSTEALARSS